MKNLFELENVRIIGSSNQWMLNVLFYLLIRAMFILHFHSSSKLSAVFALTLSSVWMLTVGDTHRLGYMIKFLGEEELSVQDFSSIRTINTLNHK